ncbi:MAG: putative metal-binding motif-containing protein [Sandaracinaceae bacterium]|nr:putative metal-binding motif-containing protein [Sandaracinaceae bacterium]
MCRAGSAPCSAAACDEAAARCRTLGVDFDGDGYPEGADCDDENASRFPYNPERCDAIDNDCDPETLGPDADGDGVVATACCNQQPNGAAPVCGTDCNDAAPAVKPSAMEICNGVDEDCDGVIDDGVQTTYGRRRRRRIRLERARSDDDPRVCPGSRVCADRRRLQRHTGGGSRHQPFRRRGL